MEKITSSMFRIALCDDNEQFIDMERSIIEKYFTSIGEDCNIDSYYNGADLISNENKLADYNLILLDCEMPVMTGLEVSEHIRKLSISVPIAFSTNYYDFTIKGYHYGIVRYLVKTEDSFADNIIECIKYVRTIKKENEFITIKIEGAMQSFRQKDIVLIASEKHYLSFYIKNGAKDSWYCSEVKVRMKLEDIEQNLGSNFLRVHQRNIVNMDFITEFTSYNVVISTGFQSQKSVSMTVRNKKDLQKKYYSYKGSLL